MLILTRRPGESLFIFGKDGKKIAEFIVLGIKGNQVRIGTNAPKEYKIERHDMINKEKKIFDPNNS